MKTGLSVIRGNFTWYSSPWKNDNGWTYNTIIILSLTTLTINGNPMSIKTPIKRDDFKLEVNHKMTVEC